MIPIPKKPPPRAGESEVVRRIREAVGKLPGVTLWRNNTGMLENRNGTKVHFGLCEGSADLIGLVRCKARWRDEGGPVIVGEHRDENDVMLSRTVYAETRPATIGRFLAMEVKQPGKKPTVPQLAFLDLVAKMGGYACCVDSVTDALEHVEKARML